MCMASDSSYGQVVHLPGRGGKTAPRARGSLGPAPSGTASGTMPDLVPDTLTDLLLSAAFDPAATGFLIPMLPASGAPVLWAQDLPSARENGQVYMPGLRGLGLDRRAKEALLADWLGKARLWAEGERSGWPQLYTRASWDGWNAPQRMRPRPIASVITAGDAGERLVADAKRFLGREEWYAARGVPWRRGYLLYGPPGTGKTSLIRAVATELGLDLAIVDLARKSLDDAGLVEALCTAPLGAALVLEDVDAAFAGRSREDAASGLTFSGLLNALDGLAAQEGRIVIMTTNHRELLDPALIRPGRADLHLEIGLSGPAEAARLFLRFFPEAHAAGKELEAALIGAVSPASVQAALLAAPDNPRAAALAVKALFAERSGGAALAAE